jgi:hypothetical protein
MKNRKSEQRNMLSKPITLCGCAASWSKRGSFRFALALVFCLTLMATGANAADTILHNFAGTPDGAQGADSLVPDKYGNLYGTTMDGGTYGYGTVYVMCAPLPTTSLDVPPCTAGAASWTEFVLYSFKGVPGTDGSTPIGTLIFGGNYAGRAFTLYGTTYYGGVSTSGTVCGGNQGCGTVFELCAPGSVGGCGGATWTETVLHAFTGLKDGAYPYAGVITDKANELYGTTVYGGALGTCLIGTANWYCGTAFVLKHNATFTTWTETIMHRFKGGADGANPYGALCCNSIFSIPYFYGTTLRGGVASGGGTGNAGVVFKLKNSPYTETILYDFCNLLGCPDGGNPYSNVVFDSTAAGNLLGTTAYGGVYGHGTIFEMPGPLYLTESAPYSFCSVAFCADGAIPLAGLTLDSANNVYGTTDLGGVGFGEVFASSPPYAAVTTLWPFAGGFGDGANPWGGVVFDPAISPSELYGATTQDGLLSDGVVYSVP